MSTSKFSRGHAKKPASNPRQGTTEPSVSEKREHTGKGPHVAPAPPVSKQRQHREVGTKNVAKESKQVAAAENINVYQGRTKPTTEHQRKVRRRGKAVRKILGYKKGETTPYQGIKRTQILREGQKALLSQTAKKIEKELKSNKLDPKTHKEKTAEKTALDAEVHRLRGRKHEANLEILKNTTVPSLGAPKGKFGIPTIGKSKAYKKELRKAKTEFKKFNRLSHKATALAKEAVSIPRSSKPVSREAINRIREGSGDPFHVSPLQGITKVGEEHHGKGDLFYVPKQAIPGTEGKRLFGGPPHIGGNYYTRAEIRALTSTNEQVAQEPSDLSVLITAASLSPFAPEAKLLQLGGKAVEAIKGLDTAAHFASDAATIDKVASDAFKVDKITEPALKQTSAGKVIFNTSARDSARIKAAGGGGVAALARNLGDEVPAATKAKVVENAASPASKQIEIIAEDPRIMAGAGGAQDVNTAMWKAAAQDAMKNARSGLQGVKLKAARGAVFTGIGAVPLVPLAVSSQNFRDAAYRDVHDIISGFVPSSVQFLTASGDALLNGTTLGQLGSTAPIEAIWKQMKKTDPFLLAIQGKWSEAEKAFKERPVSGLIEAGGVYAGVGRTLGTAAREGLPGDFASLKGGRVQHVTGDFYNIKDYSPNLFTQQLQILGDKMSFKVNPDDVKVIQGKDGRQHVQYKNKATAVKAKLSGQKQLIRFEHAIDHHASVYLIHSRQSMKEVETELSKIVTKASKGVTANKHAGSALPMIVTKLIRSPKTVTEDLATYKKHLEDQIGSRASHQDKSILYENLSIVNTLIKHKDKIFKDDKLWKLAEDYRLSEHSRQEELIAMNAVDPKAAEYAPWIPYAVHHMGAKFDPEKGTFKVDIPTYNGVHVVSSSSGKDIILGDKPYDNRIPFIYEPDSGKVFLGDRGTTHADMPDQIIGGEGQLQGEINLSVKPVIHFDATNNVPNSVINALKDSLGLDIRTQKQWTLGQVPKVMKKTHNPKELSVNDIKAAAKDDGVIGDPGMITSRMLDGGHAGEYEQAILPSVDTFHSTGKAFELGEFDLAARSMLRQGVITRQVIDQRNYAFTMLHDGAARAPGQKDPFYFKNKAEADLVNQKYFSVHGLEMEPFNLKKFVSEMTVDTEHEVTVNSKRARNLYKDAHEAMKSALLKESAYKDDAWVLVPKRMLERMNEHAQGVKQVGSIIRKINREFKGSVLAFSPKWHIGNLVDMATRMYFQGVGVQSYVQGARLLHEVKQVDPALYNDMMATIMGGHLKSSGDIIRSAEGIDQRVFDAHQLAAQRAATTAFRLGGKGYRKLQELSFAAGGEFEHIARTAGLGKAARLEARRLGHSWTKATAMQHDVLVDLVENLKLDSNVQRKYGKYVNKVFGDYTTMSPEVRFSMQTYAPFLMWLRASTKWALTLPKESPTRTAMVVSVNRMNEPERRKLGLSTFTPGAETVPTYMLGSIPVGTNNSELLRTQAYTSLGPLTDIEALAGFILPQFDSLIEAWKGKDWLGQEIVNPNGKPLTDPERLSIVAMKILETYVAPIGYAHKIIAHGDPSETFSIFDLDTLAKGPSGILKGAQERKHYKNEYGYTQEEKEEIKESPSKKDIWGKVFSPLYHYPNPVLENKQYKRKKKKEEAMGITPSSKTPEDEESEFLYGTSTGTTQKKDKRVTKTAEKESSWLYGE